MSIKKLTEQLLEAWRRQSAAFCLIGVWFSSGCDLGTTIDAAGTLREATVYRAAFNDTLIDVARRFNLGFVELVAANPETDPWLPGEGTEVVLPTVHLMPDAAPEGIIINLADMRLYFFGAAGQPPKTYPIGIGREGLTTPQGVTKIVRKAEDPVWRPTARMRSENPELPAEVFPGPDNPLGNRAMYLGWPQYLIHGTNKPAGVGRRTSSGCVRMYPEDVEALFEQVPIGTKVTVVDQPLKFGWIDGQLFMEAHPTQQQSDQLEFNGHFQTELENGIVERVHAAAGDLRSRIDWSQVRRVAVERRGYPVQITR